MDKKLLIIGGVVLLVLIVVGLFVFTGSSESKDSADTTNITNPALQADLDALNQGDIALDSNEISEIIEVN
ncbi:MAG: hypothetical protein WCX82_04485 [archaeon]|jgi:uncharacterized protein YpmB